MKPWEFGRLTPGELFAMLEGYNWRQEQEWQRVRWAVWHTEALSRTKKLPKFERFANVKKAKKERQSVEEQVRMAEAITKAFGGVDKRKK